MLRQAAFVQRDGVRLQAGVQNGSTSAEPPAPPGAPDPAHLQGAFSALVVKWSSRGQKVAREEPAAGDKRKAPEHGDTTNTEVWQHSCIADSTSSRAPMACMQLNCWLPVSAARQAGVLKGRHQLRPARAMTCCTCPQVFVAKVPVTLREADVQPVFEAHGRVEKVVLFRANPRDVRTKVAPTRAAMMQPCAHAM